MKTSIDKSEIRLFKDINAGDLTPLLHCMRSYNDVYKKGELIDTDRNGETYIGIVMSGSVHMMKEDISGNQTMLAYMNAGEIFGESTAIGNYTKEYISFIAASDCEIMFLSMHMIMHNCGAQCEFHHKLTQNLLNLIAEKNANLMEKIEVSTKRTVREKILAYLSIQAQKSDSTYIQLPLTRTELAAYIGANRSAMTRELALMKEEGLIDFDKNTFVLK